MKKAKEYAQKIIDVYIQKDSEQATREALLVVNSLIHEIFDIAKSRNSDSDSALLNILKEQNVKWKSICARVNKEIVLLSPDAFLELMKLRIPNVYELLINSMK